MISIDLVNFRCMSNNLNDIYRTFKLMNFHNILQDIKLHNKSFLHLNKYSMHKKYINMPLFQNRLGMLNDKANIFENYQLNQEGIIINIELIVEIFLLHILYINYLSCQSNLSKFHYIICIYNLINHHNIPTCS